MPAHRNRRSLLALLLLAALLLLTLDFREGGSGPLSSSQRFASGAFAPLQDALAASVRPIGDLVSAVGDLGALRERNAELEAEVRELQEQAVMLADVVGENRRLRELAGMRERVEPATTAARVIAQPPGVFRWSVLIDIGSDHGVERNMAVVNADGLVGKVVEVAPTHARVQLAVSPNAGYAVRVDETGQQALLSGRGGKPMQLQVTDDPEREVPPGSRVLTRWFQGTAIPDGLPVGVVADTPTDQPGSSAQFIPVRPFVDFRALDLVLVVLDAPRAPLDDDEDEAAAEEEPPADAGSASP